MVSSRQTDRQSENYDARSDAPDMASAKLQNILSFLDEVETKDQLDSIYKEVWKPKLYSLSPGTFTYILMTR